MARYRRQIHFNRGPFVRPVLNSEHVMSEKSRTIVATRVFRGGTQPPDDEWADTSPAERLAAVWELTQQCLQWNRTGTDEPRLQRSVGRVQRARR